MDIISLLANQAGPSPAGRQDPTREPALTDFAQVIARVADSLKASPGSGTLPGFGTNAEEPAFPGLQVDTAQSALAGSGQLPEGLSELMDALRDNLRRGAAPGGARESSTNLADELLDTTPAETGDLAVLEQLSALAAAAAALTNAEEGRAAASSDSRGAAVPGEIAQPATSPVAEGAKSIPGATEPSSPAQFPAAAGANANQSAKDALITGQLAPQQGKGPAMAADPDAQLVPGATDGQNLPTDSDRPLTSAAGGREPSPWAAELSTKSPAETATNRLQTGGPGSTVEATALSSTQQTNLGGTAAPSTQATLSQQLASPGWSQQFSQQVLQFAQRGDRQVELRLNPAELGPLSISLRVDEQGAQAHFLSAHASVRAAVEQAIPQLRETLAEQGITLAEAQVGEQGFGRSRDQAGQDSGSRGQPEQLATGNEPIAAVDGASTSLESGLPGAVDTWA